MGKWHFPRRDLERGVSQEKASRTEAQSEAERREKTVWFCEVCAHTSVPCTASESRLDEAIEQAIWALNDASSFE